MNQTMTNGMQMPARDGDDLHAIRPRLGLDFREIWAAVFRSRVLVLSIMAACVVLAVAITLLTTPTYRATATMQIDQEAAKVLGTEQTELSASIQDAERFLQTQIDVLQSRSVAMAVARDLKLFSDDRFLTTMDVNPEIAESSALPLEDARRELILKTLRDNFSASIPRVSRLARVGFESPDPALSAQVANAFADNFIRENLQRRFDASSYARKFLEDQLKQAQIRLEESERAAVSFARATGIVDASRGSSADGKDAPGSLVTSTLVQLNDGYSEAMAKQLIAEGKWQRSRGLPIMTLPEVLQNPAIQELSQLRAENVAKLEEERERRTADHPAVRQIAARLAEIDRQIAGIATNIRNSLKADSDITRSQSEALRRQVNRYKDSTLTEQNQSIQLSILRREASTNRLQYEALLRRYNEITAEAGVQSNNITIVDKAAVPTKPDWPKWPLNIALALFVGAALSGLAIVGREQIFVKVRTPEDIRQRIGLPVLGAIPEVDGDLDLAASMRDPKSQLSEAFNSVRTALSVLSENGIPHTLAFTSTQASEGKSNACYATAFRVSRLGKKTLVIDLDLRRPNQHNLFGVKNTAGMSNVLSGEATAQDVIVHSEEPNLDVITGGPIPPNPTELLTTDRLRSVLAELKTSYDAIFVDSAPVLALADAVVLGSQVDASVFVIESGRNNPSSIKSALQRLKQANVVIAGIILSRYNPGQFGYGDGYHEAYRYESKD